MSEVIKMDKIKILSKVGIGLAVVDYVIRGFGPLYTSRASEALSIDHFIWNAIIPLFAVITSLGFIKGKKWGLYIGVVFVLLSLIGSSSVLRGGQFNMLAVLYLIIYGILVFLGFSNVKKLK